MLQTNARKFLHAENRRDPGGLSWVLQSNLQGSS